MSESNRQSSPSQSPSRSARAASGGAASSGAASGGAASGGGTRRGALLLPPAIVLAIALLGSISVHLPIYAGLGALASVLSSRPPRERSPSSIEITIADPAIEDEPESAGAPEPVIPEDDSERAEHRREPAREAEVPQVVPPAPAPPPETPAQPAPPRPPPSELDERRAIVQRSRDPHVESPEDAQFIADEAQDVEEQTVAEITNTLEDAPDPQTSSETPPAEPTEVEGDSEDEVVADLRDVEGDDRRRVTLPESERDRTEPAESDPSTSPTPSAVGGESLDPDPERTPRQGERVRSMEGGAVARGGGEPVHDEVIVSDGFGSFAVRVPREAPIGSGEGEGGGARIAGRGLGAEGAGTAGGRAGRTRGGAREGGSESGRGHVQLGLSWSQFEGVYGEERLERERVARLEERRSRSRGASRAQRWEQFRSAIENYVSEVRTGNQTALDAAASPFATFLSDMHRRIHGEFADRYLASIPIDASEDLNNASLNTTLEIAVNPDGTIHRVGIVATSGNILFDFGAFNSVMRAQPFPRPPSIILSGDGHAWLHWRFDRGPRQCGTWNARPFLLENAPLIDRGEPPEIDPDEDEVEGGMTLEERLRARAAELGFVAVGIARAEALGEEGARLRAWLGAGRHGAMAWMEESASVRIDPRDPRMLPSARSVIVMAAPYARRDERVGPAPGIVARYARGRDYHNVLGRRAKKLAAWLRTEGFASKAAVDSQPVFERAWAQRAGIGFVGKNCCVIVPGLGSHVLLAVVITSAELAVDAPMPERCGSCTRCLDACPTSAFVAARELDARRCISYLTIEHQGAIDPALRAGIGDRFLGCDVCQDVCPFNRTAPPDPAVTAAFAPDPRWERDAAWILRMSEEDHDAWSLGSPARRPRRAGLARNAAIVLGNAGGKVHLPVLREAAERDAEESVRDAARWAVTRIVEREGEGER